MQKMEGHKVIVGELEDILGRYGYVRFRQPGLPGECKIAYVKDNDVVTISSFPKAGDLIIQSVETLEKVAIGISEDQEEKAVKSVKRLGREKGDSKHIKKGDVKRNMGNADNEDRYVSPLLIKYFKGHKVKIETLELVNGFTCTMLDADNFGILVEVKGKKAYVPIYNVLTVEEADF